MSTEIQRRVDSMERRVFGATNPCSTHPSILVLHDPTEPEIAASIAASANCPVCRGSQIVVAVPNFARLFRETSHRRADGEHGV